MLTIRMEADREGRGRGFGGSCAADETARKVWDVEKPVVAESLPSKGKPEAS